MTAPVAPPSGSTKLAFAATCACIAVGMVGLAYAAVPLYDMFCRVTGFGGTTQEASFAPGPEGVLDQTITVRFDASRGRGMPWTFEPLQVSQTLRIGETGLAFYRVTNPTNRTIVGTATYNVTPQKIGPYFAKIECFCFTEQTLGPGESMDMPVSYFVDPRIASDKNTDEVTAVTLSYTFFVVDNPTGAQKPQQTAALTR